MRKSLLMKRILVLLLVLLPCVFTQRAEGEAPEADEWTVMFYLCGSDLESKYSFATGNLEEIAEVNYPDSILPDIMSYYGKDDEIGKLVKPGKVNVLLQTGGSSEWHCGDLGMEVRTDMLQRWRYNVFSLSDMIGREIRDDGYELLETIPLQSMADPETLTDFIRWGAQTCPAKKYALVLWDHGGGAKTGLFIDELFKGDIMYLYELKQALADSGVHLEALVIDACMMANLETAWAVSDSANYLISSEEVVPGKGTAIDEWLQALFGYPACDGEWLGRIICDKTAIKYANESDDLSRSLLTWSVIDLGRIGALVDAVGEFFRVVDDALVNYPTLIKLYSDYIYKADEYGDGAQNMRDLGSVFHNPEMISIMDVNLRGRILEALSKAVVYALRGEGRSEALGLSFCYPADFDNEELEIYAKNFPLPPYLAYLDAINDWTAPEWVYDETARLPEISTMEELCITLERKMNEKGMPALFFPKGDFEQCFCRLYRLDKETGQILRLGRTACELDYIRESMGLIWYADDPMHWPAVEGQLCCMDLVQKKDSASLYNIPVQINSETTAFRCGQRLEYTEEKGKSLSDYEIFGVWQGYDADSDLMNRSVTPLAMLMGRDYKLLYPIDDGSMDDADAYESGEAQKMFRSLNVEEIPLPPGTYYLEYEVQDMFLYSFILDRIEIHWDGETMTFPEGFTWEGKEVMHRKAQ